LQVEVAASQEALRQAVQRYGVGLAINLDVLNAETQLLSSQLSLAQGIQRGTLHLIDGEALFVTLLPWLDERARRRVE